MTIPLLTPHVWHLAARQYTAVVNGQPTLKWAPVEPFDGDDIARLPELAGVVVMHRRGDAGAWELVVRAAGVRWARLQAWFVRNPMARVQGERVGL